MTRQAAPGSPPLLTVDDLTFRYVGRRRPAFQQVAFSVLPGEVLLVLGPSGCGKSTLALALNGLIPQLVEGELTGRVVVGGHDTRTTPLSELARRVGMVFQDPETQFCLLNVADEVAFGLENLAVPPRDMEQRIDAALSEVGLLAQRQMRIDRLSGGMKQRLALACVLAMEPEILVFDEPTSNLDPHGAAEVFQLLAELRARGDRTIILIEHRLDALMHLVDRVLVLTPQGTVLAHGEPRQIIAEHLETLEQFGIWVPQVSELAGRLAARGVRIHPFPLTVEEAVAALAASPAVARASHDGAGDARPDTAPVAGHEPASIAIATRNLSYTYPTGQRALHDVTIEIGSGDFVAIVGENGAGKSTLAKHLIDVLTPPPGTVFLGGRDIRTMRDSTLAQRIGYVFQNPEHQFVAATVFEELAFGLRLRGLAEHDIHARVEAMLTEFGLSRLARAHPFTLSHGEKRRLSVATMLILGQDILLLDEPTFGQDRRNSDRLLGKLAGLNQAGRTIVAITHDMRVVAEFARRVIVLAGGRLLFAGPPRHLFADAALLRAAALCPPPLLEVSQRLARVAPWPPDRATLADYLTTLRLDDRVEASA